MTKRIFRAITLVAAVVLLASFIVTLGVLSEYFGGVQKELLHDELGLAAAAVETDGTEYLERAKSANYRLTWIAADGTVMYDSQADASSMENHLGREEVDGALKTGVGESTRYSSTLLEKTTYYARRLSDGTVLRISASRHTAVVLALGMLQPMLVVLTAAIILALLLAKRVSARIVDPLNELDLEHPLDNDAYEELSPLLGRINRQHTEIDRQLKELRRRTDEFTQITGSMREGLVLLDERGYILSINAAAKEIFGADDGSAGQDFLTIDRSSAMSGAVQAAMRGGHAEIRSERAGRNYRFDLTRIESGGRSIGAVILAFDVTEQERAERMRREFTANVSHELKTPLQGIIGSAELIENGLVKPEDMPRFVGHIHSEASRLMALISDIIRLSQLDEGEDMPRGSVDLYAEAAEAEENLRTAAEEKGVKLRLTGECAEISGVRRLVYEIIYNLCDNAIKYNRPGGSVEVSVTQSGTEAAVTVADTGIGIAPEDQARVFERFYRADKSRSKESGGTGLGLSIVKHAVQYHHGSIDLRSTPGGGTTIKVMFPK